MAPVARGGGAHHLHARGRVVREQPTRWHPIGGVIVAGAAAQRTGAKVRHHLLLFVDFFFLDFFFGFLVNCNASTGAAARATSIAAVVR